MLSYSSYSSLYSTTVKEPKVLLSTPASDDPLGVLPSKMGGTDLLNDIQEYGAEIFEYMTNNEDSCRPVPAYMDSQPEITWKMRKTLILWLIEVHIEYNLRQETLYLAVSIIDRMCSKIRIARHQYQLLGISSLWLAAKYEENHGKVPSLKNLAFICCHSYREKDFCCMERVILKELSFELGAPTPESFLKIHCALYLTNTTAQCRALSRYIMELTLVHRRFVGLPPSLISLASLLLGDEILGYKQWYYEDQRLSHCIEQLYDCLYDPPKQLLKKFSSDKWFKASHRVQAWIETPRLSSLDVHGLLTPPKESLDEQRWNMNPLSTHLPYPSQTLTPTSPTHPLSFIDIPYPPVNYSQTSLCQSSKNYSVYSHSRPPLPPQAVGNPHSRMQQPGTVDVPSFWDLHLMPARPRPIPNSSYDSAGSDHVWGT